MGAGAETMALGSLFGFETDSAFVGAAFEDGFFGRGVEGEDAGLEVGGEGGGGEVEGGFGGLLEVVDCSEDDLAMAEVGPEGCEFGFEAGDRGGGEPGGGGREAKLGRGGVGVGFWEVELEG